jgi:hypothetical protein
MDSVTRIHEPLAESAGELAHAERLIDEQVVRIDTLAAEVARLRSALGEMAL